MIIKTLSRKSGTGQLLEYVMRYILDDEKQLLKADLKSHTAPFLIKHNLRSKTIAGFVKEFQQNEQNRIHKRSNQNTIEHVILSWLKEDTAHLSDKALKDMAKQYIKLRGENNLYLGSKHMDKDHLHIHLCMSATQLNGLSSRISKQEFAQLKVALQEFQKVRYPQLVSLPHHGRAKEQQRIPEKEFDYPDKSRTSNKEMLREVLKTAYKHASSQQQFLESLEEENYKPYYRSGRLTGVTTEHGRNFRLKTFGYDKTALAELDLLKEDAVEKATEIENRTQPEVGEELSERIKNDVQNQEQIDIVSQLTEMNELAEMDEMEELQSIRKRTQSRELGRPLGGSRFEKGSHDIDEWEREE